MVLLEAAVQLGSSRAREDGLLISDVLFKVNL